MWKIPANDSVSFGTHAAVAVGLLCCDGSLSGTHRPVERADQHQVYLRRRASTASTAFSSCPQRNEWDKKRIRLD